MALEPMGPDQERGVVVNTASITAYEGQIGQGAYVASKGAIAAMTIQAAREFAARGCGCWRSHRDCFTPRWPPKCRRRWWRRSLRTRSFRAGSGRLRTFADLCLAMIRNPMLNGEVIRLDAGVRLRAR